MADPDPLSAALEDYLEAIAELTGQDGGARVGDIARALSVHKSTVTAALKSLAEKKLVHYAPYERARLTRRGRRIAREVRRRHRLIRRFLIDVLCLDEDAADENACRMEHVVDADVLRRLAALGAVIADGPPAGAPWCDTLRAKMTDRPDS
ncbi:MAG: metal-dependent transcriptional regulator [Planctomycetota bacterium]